jgi:hypothetical protein
MRPEYQVKQFVAELNGCFGTRWRVFTTGSERHYLLVESCFGVLQVPVAKADLRPEIRSALTHGWGHAPRQP